MMTTNEARTEYLAIARRIAAKTGWTAEKVNDEIRGYAHEMADGEERLPRHWVEGANELEYLLDIGVAR